MDHQCDIVLLSYESPQLLRKCVRSVLDHTRVSSRLIVVDNASKDPGVKQFLGGIHGNSTVEIEKLFSEENAGFAAGMNKGMRLADSPFVCLLNNDCVVTEGWLEEMIAVSRSRDDIGLVNPQSNTFGSRPDAGASIDSHAMLLSDRRGRFVELGHAIGFACLIKKEVIDRIGYLDEEYEGVCYEDTDFSVRAQKAGYISVMAEGAYVFHVEQASRRNMKDKGSVYKKNREIFERKWGRLLRIFYLDNRQQGEVETIKSYEALKGIARERAIVDFWVRQKRGGKKDFFGEEKRATIKHADIGVTVFSGNFIALAVLLRVLTKKKKYDAVITDKGVVSLVLRILKFLHGTEVFTREGSWARKGDMVFDLNQPSGFAEYLRKRK